MKLRKKVPPLATVKSDSIGFPPQGIPSPEKPRYCKIPSALLSPTCVSFTSISASIFWL